jgi:queuosine precursor transporter
MGRCIASSVSSYFYKFAIAQHLLKPGGGILMTPVTWRIVAFFKKRENEDWYDRNTSFNPFSWRV